MSSATRALTGGDFRRGAKHPRAAWIRGGVGQSLVVAAIALVHAAFLALLMREPIEVKTLRAEPMFAFFLSPDQQGDAFFKPAVVDNLPRIDMEPPVMAANSMPDPIVESPRIDPEVRLYMAPFTARASLANGEVATVLLLLQIAADGSVISAEVVRSNSNDAANAAAIDYARATRWIPGTVEGEPRAMQASLTVILGEAA